MQLLHFYGVVLWVGGMFFAHYCLRPEVARLLEPPQRLELMSAVLERFFAFVTVAVLVIVFSGFFMFGASGNIDYTPFYWRLMMMSGLVMAAVFAIIRLAFHPRLRAAVAAQDWPQGARALDRIRQLVVFNLALGVLTIGIAVLGAYGGLGAWGSH